MDEEHIAETGAAKEEGGTRRGQWLKTAGRWSPLIILTIAGIAVAVFGFADQLSMSSIIESRTDLQAYVEAWPFRTTAIYVGIYIVAVVLSVPGGSLLTVIGGILFGGIVGGLITTVAAAIGSVLVFLVARTALAGWVTRRAEKMGPRVASFTEGFRTNAFYVIVVLRLIPVMPYWASNALPGLFGVKLWVFGAATLVGLLPWTVSFAFFGEALDEIVVAQEIANPGCAAAGTCSLEFSAITSGPVITGVVIAMIALVPVGLHWWSRRRKRTETDGGAPSA
jgi:uncharacterized membrane protein YdjX (TVP38/TMEM64 family)